VQKLRDLPTGTKLVLVAGPLLFLSLFFDWQTLHVDYGPAGIAKLPQDGWDAWGLLLGGLTISVVVLVVLRRLTEVEMSEDVPWETVILGLSAGVLVVAVVKNLLDAYSTWISYGFLGLAALLAFGAYLDWAAARREARGELRRRSRRRVSSTA